MIKFLPATLFIIFLGSVEIVLADRFNDCAQLEKPDCTIHNCTQFLKRGKKETRNARSAAYNNRDLAYAIKRQHDRAIEDFNKAIQLNPKFADAYIGRGIAYRYKGRDDLAIKDFNNAIQFDPKFSGAYNNRGSVYGKRGQHDLAVEDFSKAIQLNPKDAFAYYNRGLTLYSMVDYGGAIEEFSKAIKLDPRYVDSYYYRGYAYSEKNQYDRAIADWRKVIEIDPNYKDAENALKTLGPKLGVPPLTEVYSNPDQGWMIVYPDGWIVDDTDPSFVKISAPVDFALVGIHTKNVRVSNLKKSVEFFINFRRKFFENTKGMVRARLGCQRGNVFC